MPRPSPPGHFWSLLGADFNPSPTHGTTREGVTFLLTDSNSDYDTNLRQRVELLSEGDVFVVATGRPFARHWVRFGSRRRQLRSGGIRLPHLLRSVNSLGFEVERVFAVWPSAEAPLLAVPVRGRHAMRWVQRTGILGGGGDRMWLRILMRSSLFTTLVTHLYPAVAVVARRKSGSI